MILCRRPQPCQIVIAGTGVGAIASCGGSFQQSHLTHLLVATLIYLDAFRAMETDIVLDLLVEADLSHIGNGASLLALLEGLLGCVHHRLNPGTAYSALQVVGKHKLVRQSQVAAEIRLCQAPSLTFVQHAEQ